MIVLLSPSKTLDWDSSPGTSPYTTPVFLEEAARLVEGLRTFSADDIARLMKISEKLAALNADRFAAWQRRHTPHNARPALLAFKGDVYTGLEAETFSDEDFVFAREHLRILSGLYGLLRPLDLIQPYRLEMGTRLSTERGSTLYDFWEDRITRAVNEALLRQATPVLVNLASVEYFRAVNPEKITARVVTPVFRDFKNGRFKVISFYAKKARGRMAGYLVRRRLEDVDALKGFDVDGYRFDASLSEKDRWVFTRRETGAGRSRP